MSGSGITLGYNNPPINPHSSAMRTVFVELKPQYFPVHSFAPQWGEMISKLAGQLDGEIASKSQILVTLAELGKTIKMVRNPFNLLRTDWRRIAAKYPAAKLKSLGRSIWKDHKWRNELGERISSSAKVGANSWLEYKYGWNAMFQDVKALAKTSGTLAGIGRTLKEGEQRFSSSEKVEASWATPIYPYGETESYWNSLHGILTNPRQMSGQIRVRCNKIHKSGFFRIGCHQLMNQAKHLGAFERLLDAYGASGSSVVSTLWELVPLSFVVDWFIDWHAITALGPMSRLNMMDVRMLGCSSKVLTSYDIEMLFSPYQEIFYSAGPAYGRVATSLTGSPVYKGTGKSETYTRSQGMPSVEQVVAGFIDAGLSVTRGISGLSLIIQRALRR